MATIPFPRYISRNGLTIGGLRKCSQNKNSFLEKRNVTVKTRQACLVNSKLMVDILRFTSYIKGNLRIFKSTLDIF